MSDEPTPPTPSLRLKPRLRPAEGEPAAAPAPAVIPAIVPLSPPAPVPPTEPPVPAAAAPEAQRFRLKPKLPVASEPVVSEVPAAPAVVAPVLFITDPAPPPAPAPAVTPAIVPLSQAAPVPPTEPPVPATASPEAQRFRLKPKLSVASEPVVGEVPAAPAVVAPVLFITDPAPASPAPPAPADIPAVEPQAVPTSPVSAAELVPPPVWAPKQGVYVTGNAVKKTLPPFPTIAVDGKDKTPQSTLPHLSSGNDLAELDPALALPTASRRGPPRLLLIALGIVALAATGFLGWLYLQGRNVAKPGPAPVKAAPAAATPTKPPAPQQPATLTPSESLNQLAQVPVNAINKAQDAIAARRAGEQARVDAVVAGEDVPNRAAPKIMAPKAPPTMTTVAPGLAASAPIDADSDSSRAFRLFVANARISGVFQGNPPRAMINGKLTRAGERVDADLGIVFEGLSPDRRQLIFTDRSGAKVFRGY